jgi:CheY-like chemotaxis protein
VPEAAGRPDGIAAASAPRATPLLLTGTTIVVVDDDGDSRDVLSALLDGTQAEIVPCDSAAAALAALDARPVDLLIADLAMPDVDGYELMGRVAGTWPALPAIAVSAFARPEDRGKALLCGYRAYCAKPVDQAQLLDTIRTVLRSGDGHR